VAADLRVRLTPRAKGPDALAGVRDGVLLVRVAAPPVDGRANVALCRLIASELGVSHTSVSVVRGQSAREKVLRIQGATDDDLRGLLRRA
jgi:uncharacterized protein YggU (UPF0235/DUF167 family)